ncbi:hypothetical protein BU582_09225 [Staphylococcus agnetis]|uniref:PH domain-containing protein n=1 Tax=Staphylococcus agnetis TaxID=985762 RepID=UPI000D19B3B4|nr:PH domain-containing protein [Staphylococcus agnetis]PTH66276.1 hypothetical protein BU582_09225 [Staphylococcus agnetis]
MLKGSMLKPSKATLSYSITSNVLQLLVEICVLSVLLYCAHLFAWHIVWTYVLVICLVLNIIMRTVYPIVSYHSYTYRIHTKVVEIRKNVWFQHYQAIKIERIQYIENVTNPLATYYKLKKLKITTAGHEIALPYLLETQANDIAIHCMTVLERGEDDV